MKQKVFTTGGEENPEVRRLSSDAPNPGDSIEGLIF